MNIVAVDTDKIVFEATDEGLIVIKMETFADAIVKFVQCKDCQEHGQRTNMCAIWHHHTNPEGYCHRAKAVKKND